jgi:quercetin dioxygenase-like cupin family protein
MEQINHTASLDWIPLTAGTSFKPITFFSDGSGYQLLLRVEPGTAITPHRHTGEVHAFVLSGRRRISGCPGELGPGSYVYEPVDNADSWEVVGDEACIIHIGVTGRVEYLDDQGAVTHHTDAGTARQRYLDWCRERSLTPDPALAAAGAAG